MTTDNALANLEIPWILEDGDTGRRRVEHRGFLLSQFTHSKL